VQRYGAAPIMVSSHGLPPSISDSATAVLCAPGRARLPIMAPD
jgi:hypothetical protein